MFIKEYVVALIVFLAIDAIWLLFISKKLYSKYLGYLMSPKPNLFAALIFYMIFIVGLVFFVISPAINTSDFLYTIKAGLLFGAITYATYDLTNLATIKDWPIKITIVDLIWGSFIATITSVITYLILI